MTETVEQWATRRNRDSARCEGIMQAYDALRDRLDETDRKILLDMARLALLGITIHNLTTTGTKHEH